MCVASEAMSRVVSVRTSLRRAVALNLIFSAEPTRKPKPAPLPAACTWHYQGGQPTTWLYIHVQRGHNTQATYQTQTQRGTVERTGRGARREEGEPQDVASPPLHPPSTRSSAGSGPSRTADGTVFREDRETMAGVRAGLWGQAGIPSYQRTGTKKNQPPFLKSETAANLDS